MSPKLSQVSVTLNFFCYYFFCATQETSKWVELSLQSIQTQIVPGSVIATPQQLQEFHQAIIRWVAS